MHAPLVEFDRLFTDRGFAPRQRRDDKRND